MVASGWQAHLLQTVFHISSRSLYSVVLSSPMSSLSPASSRQEEKKVKQAKLLCGSFDLETPSLIFSIDQNSVYGHTTREALKLERTLGNVIYLCTQKKYSQNLDLNKGHRHSPSQVEDEISRWVWGHLCYKHHGKDATFYSETRIETKMSKDRRQFVSPVFHFVSVFFF